MSGPAAPTSGPHRSLEETAQVFEEASRALFRHAPLYRALSAGAARDPFLLGLAAGSRPGQSPALMLLAAVHDLILRGVSHPLAAVYEDLAAGRPPTPLAPLAEDPFPLFRDFCAEHVEAIRPLVETRSVQTNEVGRSVYIRLGLEWLGLCRGAQPVSLVEIGASAGLNLCWDRYAMQLVLPDGDLWAGDPASPVRLRCEVREGTIPRQRGAQAPEIVERLGLELDPPDLESPEEVRWLTALLWADHPERIARFRAAVELARRAPWPVLRADVSRDLVRGCAGLRSDTLLCVVHTYLTTQLTPELRRGLEGQLARLSEDREVVQIGAEQPQGDTRLAAAVWRNGRMEREETLATGAPHAQWIAWCAG